MRVVNNPEKLKRLGIYLSTTPNPSCFRRGIFCEALFLAPSCFRKGGPTGRLGGGKLFQRFGSFGYFISIDDVDANFL